MGKFQEAQYFSAARTTRRFGKIAAVTKGAENFEEMRKSWGGGATG